MKIKPLRKATKWFLPLLLLLAACSSSTDSVQSEVPIEVTVIQEVEVEVTREVEVIKEVIKEVEVTREIEKVIEVEVVELASSETASKSKTASEIDEIFSELMESADLPARLSLTLLARRGTRISRHRL